MHLHSGHFGSSAFLFLSPAQTQPVRFVKEGRDLIVSCAFDGFRVQRAPPFRFTAAWTAEKSDLAESLSLQLDIAQVFWSSRARTPAR